MSQPASIAVECPHCQARFRVQPQHLGRRTRCPKCQQAFEMKEREPSSESPSPSQQSSTPIGVNCRLCGTRMYAHVSQVGQQLACPDCSKKTRVPPPPPPRVPKIPAAMLGEQYELYEGDQQPWGTALAAAQAKSIPVHCELCNTLCYAEPQQVGELLECPDCGHATRVRPLATQAATARAAEPDLEVEPVVVSEITAAPTGPSVYSRLHDFESLSSEDRQKAIERVSTDRRARPKIPRWPLLTGWGAFVRGPGVVARWLVLSLWLPLVVTLAASALGLIFAGGPYGAVAGLPLLCGAGVVAALWLGATAAIAMTIVTESSEGNNTIAHWPTINPTDWLVETGYLAVAAAASAAPGYIFASLAGIETMMLLPAMLLSSWICFPLMHLSTLEASAPFALVMPGVLASLREHIGSWVLCYLLSGAMAAAVAGTFVGLAAIGAVWALLAAPVLVAAVGLYFRLLGRLAWRVRYDEDE